MEDITSKGIALITGGCSGIGRAIANELAQKGYDLILASNQEERLHKSCEEIIAKYHIKVRPVFIDLALPDAAVKLYEYCHSEQLEVDILVNNAGIFFFGEVVETPGAKAQCIMTLHTTTPALLCTLFGKDMKAKRSGHILNISSLAASLPYPGIAFYSSTKRFLKSFSRSLRTEMIDYNVNVTWICPGAVSTQLYDLKEADHKRALRYGIMMRPERLAALAVKAMFKKKASIMPGLLNRIFLPLMLLIPHGIILVIKRHSGFFPTNKS